MDTDTERTFNVLEVCCFPTGCLLPEGVRDSLATVFVPELEEAGMSPAEWTRGALQLEEPHLSNVKSIVCKRCNMRECPFNPHSA